MAELPLQDVDGIKYPKRRPWLVLVVVVGIGAILFWRQAGSDGKRDTEGGASRAAVSEPDPPAAGPASPRSALPAPASPKAAAGPAAAGSAVASPAPQNLDVARILQEARAAEAREAQDPTALAEARRLYLAILKQGVSLPLRTEVEQRLGRINVALALTPLPLPGLKVDYVVKSGDSIDRISKRLGTTTRLIERSNQVANPNRIKAGDRFRILTGTYAIAVNKTSKDLLLTLNGDFFKRYGVGTGKFGKTPVGTFEIYDKIPEPTWWRPDGKEVPFGNPENILGTRWMAIRAVSNTPDVRGYGIHGTWDDSSIGKDESAGCVRMRNPEVEELFDLVPMGTRVVIVE